MNRPQAIPMNGKWRLVRHHSDVDLAAWLKAKRSLYDLPPVVQYLTEYGTWEPWGNFIQFVAREFHDEASASEYIDHPFGDLPEEDSHSSLN